MTLLLRRVSTMRIRIQHSVCLQPLGFRIRILKSRSGFGLIKQGLSHVDHHSQVFWRSIGMCVMFSATSCPSVNHATIGSASLARSIRIRFHFRHRTGRIRSVSDPRAGRVWRSRHRSKTPNCLPDARDQVPALFRNAIERRGASSAARQSHKVQCKMVDNEWLDPHYLSTYSCILYVHFLFIH